MLSIKNITKVYGRGKLAVSALKGISIDFPEHGMVMILGKSGCGKSTLLNILGGLDRPTTGDVLINGKGFSALSSRQLDDYRNTYVGFVFQNFNIIENRTVYENIELALKLQNNEHDVNYIDDALNAVGLNGLGYRKPAELSGGQRQRVAIARALVKNPDIILADEPSGSLDSGTGEDLFVSLKKISRKRLVIVVTHDTETAYKYGDRIIALSDGNIISDVDRTNRQSDAETRMITDGIMFVKAGHYLSTDEANSILHTDRDNYLTVEEDRQHVVLAYPDTIDLVDDGYAMGDFVKHTPPAPEPQPEFKLRRAVMSLKNCFSQAWANVRKRKRSYISLLIISSMCMTLFNIGTGLSLINAKSVITKTVNKYGVDFISLSTINDYRSYNDENSVKTINEINSLMPEGICGKRYESEISYYSVNDLPGPKSAGNSISNFIDQIGGTDNPDSSNLKGYVEFTDYSKSNIKLLYGQYPSAAVITEIMITDCLAEKMLSCGFIDYENGEYKLFMPETIEEITGKTLLVGTSDSAIRVVITGIIETNYQKIKEASSDIKNFDLSFILSGSFSTPYKTAEKTYYLDLFVNSGFSDYLIDNMPTVITTAEYVVINFVNENGSNYATETYSPDISGFIYTDGCLSVYSDEFADRGFKLFGNEVILPYSCAEAMYYNKAYMDSNSKEIPSFKEEYAKELLADINLFFESRYSYGINAANFKTSNGDVFKIVGFASKSDESIYFSDDIIKEVYRQLNKATGLTLSTSHTDIGGIVDTAQKKSFNISSAYFGNVISTLESLKEASVVLLIISAVVSFFVLITVISFLVILIRERTKEIGIMRALGATNNVTLKVFYLELGMISASVTIISSIFGAWILSFVNSTVGTIFGATIVWVSFGFINLIICAAVFTLFLLLAAWPLLGRLSRRQPIDVINTI